MFFTEIQDFDSLIRKFSSEKIHELEKIFQKIQTLDKSGDENLYDYERGGSWNEDIWNFWKFFYANQLIIRFNWSEWDKGINILHNPDHYDFFDLSLLELCKLLTTISRADRFTNGYMLTKFKDGTTQKIISALVQKLKQ